MHPFALGLTARTGGDGIVATIGGMRLTMSLASKTLERGGRAPVQYESATLAPSGPFTVAIAVQEGRWTYRSADGRVVVSDVAAGDAWHQLLVSHYTARGQTLFFVDGRLAGRIDERLEPQRFALGGTAAADVKDLLVYRSALNPDEAAALHGGALLQASLEVYSPLDNVRFEPGAPVANLAQSATSARMMVGGGR